MTRIIQVNCRKLGIGLLATLWIVSSTLTLIGAYLHYETVESFDSKGCHYNYIENREVCQFVWDKNHFAYDLDGNILGTIDYFKNYEYFFIAFFIIIQVSAFAILNAWKHWVEIKCIQHNTSPIEGHGTKGEESNAK